jgi:four helix bundle protein
VNPDELRKRTQKFAMNIIDLVQSLPHQSAAFVIGRQLLRCGTSVGANYRAACRAKSGADFISKLKMVEEECDESIYWMELLSEMKPAAALSLAKPMEEAHQILSIIVASIKTARSSNRQS